MLYQLLKPLVHVFYRVYYKLSIAGIKHMPANKPLVLAPNHTNGFIDPVTIGTYMKPKVRFFARGDVFKGKLIKWVLNDLNMSPMYRLQEGYGEIKKNNKTFEECKQLLSNNKILLIFPEAICIPEKRLQPLKKGLTRIVFQTEEAFDFKKDVLVLPIGLNYTKARQFRSEFFVNYGKPISLKSYETSYKNDKVKTINEFTKMLEREMRKLIITINNKENDALVEGIHEIYLYQWMKEKHQDYKSIEKKYHARKAIVDLINQCDEQNPERIHQLKSIVLPYLKNLKKHKLRDHLLYPETIENSNLGKFFLEFITIWLGMPIYGLGLMMNYLPFYIAKRFADEKIKKEEFYASIYANMAMLLWVPYILIQLVVVALAFKSWIFLGMYALLIPITGYYVLNYYPIMKKIFGRWQLLRLVRQNRKAIEELIQQRMEIMDTLTLLKKEFDHH